MKERPQLRRVCALLALISSLGIGLGAFSWLHQAPYRPSFPEEVHRPERSESPKESLPSATPAQDAALRKAPTTDASVAPVETRKFAPRALAPDPRQTENTLLVGLDRYGGTRGGRTDTLLLALFDPKSGHLGVLSIPRDLYVSVPGHGYNRINTVYGFAQRDGRDPLGAVAGVVSDTLQLPIGHTLAIDLSVFERTIDLLGGVSVEVACPIVDDFLDSRTQSGRRTLSLSAGTQHLDGATAAMFVRSRHGRSDFGRARRQQLTLMGIRRSLTTAGGIAKIPRLLGELSNSIVTDMNRLELLSMARRWLSIPASHVHGAVIGAAEVTPHRTAKNSSVLLADELAIEQRLRTLFEAPSPGTRRAQSPCLPADVALRREKETVAETAAPVVLEPRGSLPPSR